MSLPSTMFFLKGSEIVHTCSCNIGWIPDPQYLPSTIADAISDSEINPRTLDYDSIHLYDTLFRRDSLHRWWVGDFTDDQLIKTGIKCRLCTPTNPHKKDEDLGGMRVAHLDVEEVGETLPGYPAGDVVRMRCVACGTTWKEELPQ